METGNKLEGKRVFLSYSRDITELTDTENNLMKAIIEVEQKMTEQSFFERSKKFTAASKSNGL